MSNRNAGFQRVEIWNARELVVSVVLTPEEPGTVLRMAKTWDSLDLPLAMALCQVIGGLQIQDSQRVLLDKLMEDLNTSLEDYPDVGELTRSEVDEALDDEFPF